MIFLSGTWIASNPFFLDLVNSNGYVNGVMYHFANDTVDYTRFDINLQNGTLASRKTFRSLALGVTATLWSTWTSSVDDPNNGDTVIVSALFNGSSVMCKYFAQTQVENPNALRMCEKGIPLFNWSRILHRAERFNVHT